MSGTNDIGRNSKFNNFGIPTERISKRRYTRDDRVNPNLARRIKRLVGGNDRLEDPNPNTCFLSFKLVLRLSIRS